jgi:hypothetical protein
MHRTLEAIKQQFPSLLTSVFSQKPGKEYLKWDEWTQSWLRPGLTSHIYKKTVTAGLLGLARQAKVAVKQPFSPPEGDGSTALEHLYSLEAIKQLGYMTVVAYFASGNSNRLLMSWEEGKHPYEEVYKPVLEEFQNQLNNDLKSCSHLSKFPVPIKKVDRQPGNYFIIDPFSSEIKRRFLVLDPLVKSCRFQF